MFVEAARYSDCGNVHSLFLHEELSALGKHLVAHVREHD